MAKKYEKVDEANEEFFRKLISETSNLEMNVKFKFFSDLESKVMLEAKKMAPLPKAVSEGVDIAIVINEDIYDRLDDNLQLLAANELIHGIEFDSEKDIVTVKQKDLAVYSDFLDKNDIKDLIVLHESVISIQTKLKEEKSKESAND